MSFKGNLDPSESCEFGCPHEGPGSCHGEHEYRWYPLAEEIFGAPVGSKWVGVCDCAEVKWVKELPADAKIAVEVDV